MAAAQIYLNGDYLHPDEAKVSVFDRGFLFGDGIYEVTSVIDGRLVDFDRHMARLRRSLGEIEITLDMTDAQLLDIHREIIARNDLVSGTVYLQVTRGASDHREFVPSAPLRPTVVAFAQHRAIARLEQAESGLTVISVPEQRWARRDIKSINLLPSVLAKMAGQRAGADEVWLVEDGLVTEGASSSAFLVVAGELVTRANSSDILPGCTRTLVIDMARKAGITVTERPFSLDEAYRADEAFLASTSNIILPIVTIDGRRIGDGRPGPVTTRLRALLVDEAENPG